MADELIPYSDPATGFTPLGSDLGSINESVIPKSRPLDPSPDHVEALRLNPEFSTDFDSKFGAGASAKYLAQSAGGSAPVAEPEKPGRYRPALTWSTADILAANKPENPIAPMADAFVDSQVRKLQATRDGAALTSVEAFMRGPGPKTKADWLDDEIRSAEWSVGYWQQEMTKTDVGRIAYNADYERAHARLEAARKAKLDLEDKSERTAEPQVQIAIASRIADQKGRVAYAEDQLEAAKDGDLGTGLNVKQYEENLRYERKKLNALETAMDYARQKKAVDAASATGEMGRSFLRSMLAETPEMLAGAVEQISKNFGSEYGQMASEIAGEVKSIAKGLKQDMPAPKQSEILALDPKSTAFANNLKLYAAHAMGQGVGSTTAFWLAAAVGGPATAGGMGITLGVGQMRNALEEEFAKEGLRLQDHDVDAIVYTFGTLIGTLDATGAMFNLNMLGREAKTAAVRHMASAIARGAAKGAIVEGGTEGLQEAIQMLGENYALDRNMDWTKFRDRVIENFAAGSIPGMAFGAKNAHTEQGSARARAEYEKILKEIEAQSTLKPGERPAETQAPTVSSQPETVSGVETEQRGGRPLPPVQAEARDPATIPKPEPVSPQPETLSELSTQEKTDLVEVAKESGIAREGEAPEETLQRMREQRAEGASFGKYDAVFDRLDAVEQELEQQRAKDATIQPDDVEAIVDMWRFVNEAARVKDPEGLIDFLRRSGGIVDFNGDVTSTLGEARMRPGLISNSGLPLDAAARLAWDHGFLTSVERPDINALLDAINEDHVGNRVVRGSDRSTLDDLKIARDMAEELSQFGIRKGMKENDVRDALKGITREGGSGTQDVAANPRGPQPRTIDQVFKGEALASYLERGGQTDVSAWPQIAEALGIELKDVGPALDAAVADGTLRKHDGRYWRNQDVFADDIPFALAGQSKEAAAQAELDKHEQVQALVRLAIGSGQAVNVPKEITGRILDEMRNASVGILDGAPVGAIERIDPIVGEADEVLLTFRALDGEAIQMTMPLSMFLGLRAFYSPIHGGVFSARLFVGQQAPNAIAGEVRHEAVHHGWNTLDVGLRDRLVGHSDALGVLDMQMGTYLTIVGDPTAAYVQSTTLREAYEERYAGRANFEDVMRQEAVAHLVELASHGYFSEAELAPIAGDLAVLRGEAVEMSPAEESAVRQSMRGQSARGATLPDGTKINGVALFAIRAYHGSPHDFDKFDLSKIGTGEGAQAYGHGLYFAENEGVAKSYRDQLSPMKADGKALSVNLSMELGALGGNVDELLKLRRDQLDRWVNSGVDDKKGIIPSLRKDIKQLERLQNKKIESGGKMYEVNIKADPEHFLVWDKPLSQQSPHVAEAINKVVSLLPADRPIDLTKTKVSALFDMAGRGRAEEAFREYGVPGAKYLDQGSRNAGEGSRNYVVFDDSIIEIVAKDGKPIRKEGGILAALSGSDAAVGRSMRADLDKLGYYSKALEAAKGLKQAKGTPEQMIAQLKSAGVKDAEIEATNLKQFLDGKTSVTRDDLVKHLTENRVGVKESKYGGVDASLDTIDHINGLVNELRQIANNRREPVATELRRAADKIERQRDRDPLEFDNPNFWEGLTRNEEAADVIVAAQDMVLTAQSTPRPDDAKAKTKWSSHSLDPSNPTYRETVLHLPTEMPDRPSAQARVDALRASVNEPGISFDEMLSRRRAADAAASEMAAASSAALKARQSAFRSGHFSEPNIIGHMMTSLNKHEGKPVFTLDQIQSDWGQKLRDGGVRDEAKIAELRRRYDELTSKQTAAARAKDHPTYAALENDRQMAHAELQTAQAAASGHPLVNTTDQWTNTTLRRALRQAVEADAEFIAIPHGDTVLSYNPGDDHGMRSFYGTRTETGIVPKNLRNILQKIDKATTAPFRVEKIEASDGLRGWKTGSDLKFDKSQTGFTLFPLTDRVKRSVMEEGQALFALGGKPLDMSPEARKARAEQMGFDTSRVLHHGTMKTFDQFDPSSPATSTVVRKRGDQIHLTSSRDEAAQYGDNIVDVYVRGRMHEASMPIAARHDEIIDKLRSVRDKNYNGDATDAAARKADRFVDHNEGDDSFVQKLIQREIAIARGKGFDGVILRGGLGDKFAGDHYIIFDPTNIRSVNATFDPAEAGSARLLAALSGGKYERRLEIPYAWSRVTKARAQQLIAELKERIESLESGKERPMGSYSVSDLANHFRENLRGIEAVLPKFDMPTEALRKPFKPSKIVEAGENFVARVATDERHKERAWTGDITYYLHRKPTEAVSKSGRLFGENATAKDLGPELGKVGLYKHDDGRWEVGMVEVKQKYRRMGVASALYDAIEEEMGIKMQPSGILLPDGYRYWSKREPESTRFHQKVNLYGNDLYLSPKRIMKDLAATEQNLSSIRNRLALLEKDGPSPTQSREDWEREVRNRKLDVASYERKRDTYMAALDAVPADGKTQEALDAMFALSGYRQGRNVTEPENLRFWQKPPASGDVLMFHGTRKTFDKFDMSYSRDFGVHFGTAEQASERLVTTDMEGARTIPVEITLKNAIVMPDPGFWGPTEVAGGLMRAGYQVAQAEFDRFQRLAVAIDEAANGNDPKATRSAIIAANQAIAEKLNALGIDGIWYRNRHEGTGWSLTVWNKGQVRSATSNDVLMAMRPSIANRTMPDGQRRVATAGTAEPARSLSQLVADLNQALGLTTRVGRLSPGLKAQASAAGGKLRGQYNTATDVTRLAIPLDIETLSHEGGHALEERFGLPLRVLMEANATEIEKLATPGNDQLSEGFAEFIRRYVTNPNMAEARAPKFFKAFEQFVDKVEPSLLKRLHEVTTGYQDWINAPSGGAVLSTIKSAKKDGLVAELTKHARKNGFRNVAVDYFHSAYTAIIDGLHPVKMAVDKLIDIANTNLATPLGARSDVGVIAARDPYKLLRLARNAYQGGHVDLMRGVRDYHTHEHKGPSLHDAIGVAMGGFESSHWTDDNIKAFGAYLISRRMVAEWNRFKAGELEGMPDKLSQADHIQAQKDFEQQFPQFIDAAELVYQYQRNLLRKAMEAGFVSEDTYEDLIKRSDYVPAHRDMSEDAEETVAGPGAQTVGANKARLLKQFRGSTRDIINPLETIAKTTYEWNFLIARNDAIKALDRLARAVGPGGGKIAERIPSSQMSGTQVNAIEIVKRAGKQAGMDEADLLFLTNTLEEQLGDDADTVIFRPGEITEGGEPIVYLWEGGKRVAIRLADGKFGKDMYESITGIGRENLGPILELVAKPSQWLRAGVTLDPAFVAANWIRDNPAAWINSADHGTFLPRADRSLRASVDALRAAFGTKVDDLDILSSTGGIVGGAGMEGMSASRIERDIKALQKKGIRIRDALPHKKQFWELTGVTETGTRLSVFRAARERALADGLDEYEATVEAAYTANDLIDFGRHGSKMLAARRLVTFLNAFVQGIDKGIRTGAGGSEVKRAVQDVISPYVRQSDGQVLTVLERKAVPVAAQFYMKMTMIGFVGFALSAVYKDDPEYEEIPEYFRNTHWIFKDATGTWRRVPKPFELGAMSLVMERTFEAYYKGDTKAMKRLVSGLGDLVAPPHVVPGVQVAYELWANKSSFTGGPIVPPNLEKLPGELQFTAYTSELSKWMAVGTGVSAAKIDHAIAGITGSLGRSLLDKSNVIMPPVGMFLQERGMPTLGLPTTPRPEQRDVDRIFVRRFTVDPARSSESKKEFWKEMSTTNGEMAIKAAGYKEFYDRAQFDEAAQTLKRMKEHERVYALVEGHGNATDKREHPMNRAKSVLEVTNGIRRDLDTGKMKDDNGNAYSPSDRRVIQEMFEQIQMREARNSQIVLGLPGFTHLKIMPVEPVIRELEAKVPSIAEELDYRLRKARVKDFDEVRDGYADLKARVLEPDYVEANPPRRKAGRRSP